MAQDSSASAHSSPSGAASSPFHCHRRPAAVGKSTLARILAERLHARRVYDCEDNPFLTDFYNEKSGSAFRAQMYFLLERQKALREALAADSPAPLLSDFLDGKGPHLRKPESG